MHSPDCYIVLQTRTHFHPRVELVTYIGRTLNVYLLTNDPGNIASQTIEN